MADTAKGPAEVVELTRAQQTAVRRLAEARATVPTFTVGLWTSTGTAVAVPAALVAAAGAALREFPAVNGTYRDGHLERFGRVNVAVAVEGPEGPLAPVVFDADAKDAATAGAELDALAARAGAGELTAPDLAGATFTLAHLSAVDRVEPVLLPGFAATLAAAGPAERLDLTLACDARALSAPTAAAFLARLGALLEAAA